jgi:putative peptide zinc metalloprotease protein
MNFNPFIKMDAYYMLMDWTEIPNLRERSFRFLNRKLLGWLGFGSEEDVKVTARESRTFWRYGLLGSAVTLLFMAAPLLQLVHLLQTRSLHGGRGLLLITACALLLARLGSLAFKAMQGLFYREYKLK